MTCRLLYLVGQLSLGGLERQLYYLLQSMDRVHYKPFVVVWNYRKDDHYVEKFCALGIRPLFLPSTQSRAGKLRAFRRLVKELCPEVVHSYSFYTNFAVWYGTWGSPAIPVGSIRQDFIYERWKAGKVLGRLSTCWPATKICNSLAAKNTAERFGFFSKRKSIYPVRNGLDINQFKPCPRPQGGILLLAVGRLYPEKRWDRLLRSLALVAAKGLKFTVFHAGDGPLRQELELQAMELGIAEFVHFLGIREDIPSLLREATFLVHTADSEGCPNVVMEAMASGRAVVATDAGDVPCLVEDGKTGFLVRRGDDSTLVESIATLISNPDLARRMGEAGRAKAERDFGLNRLVSETLAVYRAAGWEGT